jgi:hypothetical protein
VGDALVARTYALNYFIVVVTNSAVSQVGNFWHLLLYYLDNYFIFLSLSLSFTP